MEEEEEEDGRGDAEAELALLRSSSPPSPSSSPPESSSSASSAAAFSLRSCLPAPLASSGGKQRVSIPFSWAQVQPPQPGTSETTT